MRVCRNSDHSRVRDACLRSLAALKLDYLDLYMVSYCCYSGCMWQSPMVFVTQKKNLLVVQTAKGVEIYCFLPCAPVAAKLCCALNLHAVQILSLCNP